MDRLRNILMNSMIGVVVVLSLMGMTLMIRASSLWSQEAAGWAQAIGSVAAIFGAYFLGERQAKAALAVVAETDRIVVRRKNDAILALVDTAVNATLRVRQAFDKEGFTVLLLHVNYDEKIMESLIDALGSVPAYELGTFNSVAAYSRLRVALFHFHSHVKRAEQHISTSRNATTGAVSNFLKWDTTALHMCCEEAMTCMRSLHTSL